MPYGAIGNLLDSLEFDTAATGGFKPTNFLQISSGYYLLVWGRFLAGAGDGIYAGVFPIDSSGNVGSPVNTVFLKSTGGSGSRSTGNTVLNAISNVYVTSCIGNNETNLLSFTIDPNTFECSELIDTLTVFAGIPTNSSYNPDTCSIVGLSGGIAIAYSDAGDDGNITTCTVDSSGNFSSAIGSWEFNATFGAKCRIQHRSGTVYIVTYSDSSSDGQMLTTDILANGTLSKNVLDSVEFDPNTYNFGTLFNINSNEYGLAYGGSGSDGTILTLSISQAGDIGVVDDSWVYDAVYANFVEALVFSDNEALDGKIILVLSDYADPGAMGRNFSSIEVSNLGVIAKSIIDEQVIDSTCVFPRIVKITNDIVAIVYGDAGFDGWIKTYNVSGFSIPDTPSNSLPVNGAINQLLSPVLSSSVYSGDGTHLGSQWQLTLTSGNYTETVYDSGDDAANLESLTIPSGTLTPGDTYYWHVRYKNAEGWSSYSSETSFSVGDAGIGTNITRVDLTGQYDIDGVLTSQYEMLSETTSQYSIASMFGRSN